MSFTDAIDIDADEVKASVAVPKYFAAYEHKFGLPVHRPVNVKVVCDRGDRLRIETDRGAFSARGLINATGTWESPTYRTILVRTGSREGNSTRAITARPRTSPENT